MTAAIGVPSSRMLNSGELKANTPDPGASSLIIVKVAVFCVPMVAPLLGLVSVKLIVSSDSNLLSLTIGIVTTLPVSPLAKETVIASLL